MHLHSDDFALMGLPRQFALDRAALDARWKDWQKQVHPDRFAAEGGAAQRLAMQWSVRINEAYQRLKHPLQRAAYLCELWGQPVRAEDNTAMPPEFLMQQMQWREDLEEAHTLDALDALEQQVQASERTLLAQCEQWLADASGAAQAVQAVRALMFVQRFGQDLEQHRERLLGLNT